MRLSDEEMKKAFADAGLPSSYHSKELSLTQLGDEGKAVQGLLANKQNLKGKFIEFCSAGRGVEADDLFYLTVRAMVVKQIPVLVVYAEDLILGANNDEAEDMIAQGGILAIEGMTPQGGDPFGDRRFSLEWRLSRWLRDNHSCVMMTDTPISSHELWSERFRALLATRRLDY